MTSFSQSSIAALLLGLAVLAAYRWDVRATVYVAVALLAIAPVLVLAGAAEPALRPERLGRLGQQRHQRPHETDLRRPGAVRRPAARGLRLGLLRNRVQAPQQREPRANATSASHTIPVTVAAEQGIVGLALYVALLVAGFVVLFRGAGRSPPRIAIAACFAALVLHTWTYADFLEDPFTWALLAIGVALALAAARAGLGARRFRRSRRALRSVSGSESCSAT